MCGGKVRMLKKDLGTYCVMFPSPLPLSPRPYYTLVDPVNQYARDGEKRKCAYLHTCKREYVCVYVCVYKLIIVLALIFNKFSSYPVILLTFWLWTYILIGFAPANYISSTTFESETQVSKTRGPHSVVV
jgi:hypothetical protein